MLLHSRQKRKVICSWVLLGCWAPSAERLEGAGEAMVQLAVEVVVVVLVVVRCIGCVRMIW